MGRLLVTLFKLWLRSVRGLRSRQIRKAWRATELGAVGKSLRWDFEPSEAWELIKLKDEEGWRLLQIQQLALLSEALEYFAGSSTPEELSYRRGFRDGILKTVQMLDKMIGVAVEDEELIRRAQRELMRKAS